MRILQYAILVIVFACVIALRSMPVVGESDDCCNGDSPECSCFIATGAWNPTGTTIQDIARATLGTRESCIEYGGKPYYQMLYGYSSSQDANSAACGEDLPHDGEAWCSETISYWHHVAGIPYQNGYRNSDWNFNWQLHNTTLIRTFYETEERKDGGRGLWIDWKDLDYADFHPGKNAPLPGSYVLIDDCTISEDGSIKWSGEKAHSMMIDELWIYRTNGWVRKVKATLLNGNDGNPASVRMVNFDDLRALTPSSSANTVGKKIRGFGVDLDENGDPIFDANKLHYIDTVDEALLKLDRRTQLFQGEKDIRNWRNPPKELDPIWDKYYVPLIPKLVEYANLVKSVSVKSSSRAVKAVGVPDGREVTWDFPTNLAETSPEGVKIEIDLGSIHPLPIYGVELKWMNSIPSKYQAQWAGEDKMYQDATVPDASKALSGESRTAAVWIPFSETGEKVRYLKLIFPKGAIRNRSILYEMRFIYKWPPSYDSPKND